MAPNILLGVNSLEDIKQSIVYGRIPVLELFKSDLLPDTLYILKGNRSGNIPTIIFEAKKLRIPVKEVSMESLNNMTENANHQGIVCTTALIEYFDIKDIVGNVKKENREPFILICDQIEDPHNLGALIRTAEAANVDCVVIPKNNNAPINATVFKTSAGALSHIKISRVTNIVETINYLKSENIWVYGADMDGETLWNTNLTGSIAIVVGAEGKGIRRLVKEKCDGIVSLPMFGKINSLNVSVAGGLLIYEIQRQRNLKK